MRKPLWSLLGLRNLLTWKGLSLVSNEWEAKDDYIVCRTSERHFLVRRKKTTIRSDSLVPSFDRIRDVIINEDNVMRCSCCEHERMGQVCRHCYSVLALLFPNRKGPGKEDLSIRWMTAYCMYAYTLSSDKEQKAFSLSLDCLYEHDSKGPHVPPEVLASAKISVQTSVADCFVKKSAMEYCTNYSRSQIMSALQVSGYLKDCPIGIPAAMSQETFGLETCDDNELFDEVMVDDDVNDQITFNDRMNSNPTAGTGRKEALPYQATMPYFKELLSSVECLDKEKQQERIQNQRLHHFRDE